MASFSVQEAQQTLAILRQKLEQNGIASSNLNSAIHLEPVLLQTLMAVTEALPADLQTEVRKIIDMARYSRKAMGAM